MTRGINIYVGNIARTVSEGQLKDLFSAHGVVVSVKLIKDKFTGQNRGFAFVEMANADEGQAAITALNGFDLDGQRLRINEAREREEGGNGGGGNGGGGGFRGPRRPYSGGGNGGGGSRGGFGGDRGGDRGGFSDRGSRY